MAQQKRGLGKGLGALIPTTPIGVADAPVEATGRPNRWSRGSPSLGAIPGAYFDEVPVNAISANPRQPRQIFDEEALTELADSIKVVGLLQPIVVRKIADGEYQLVMGERRWRASQLAELEVVPAIVRETSDSDMLRDALIENLHRQQLNALEEAAAYQQLLDDFEATHEELAQQGRSFAPAHHQYDPAAELAAQRAAPSRGRSAERWACPGAACYRRSPGPGTAGSPHRRRGTVGPSGGRDRRHGRADPAKPRASSLDASRSHHAWPISPVGSLTYSTPGSRSS